MELFKDLAQQFIADTDNDGNIDVTEVIASMSTLLSGTSEGSQSDFSSIVSSLEGSGLSDIAASWLGNGDNMPISSEQVGSLFESDKLESFGTALGLDPGTVQKGLALVVPQLIDQLSPNGQLIDPSNIDLGDLAAGLKKFF